MPTNSTILPNLRRGSYNHRRLASCRRRFRLRTNQRCHQSRRQRRRRHLRRHRVCIRRFDKRHPCTEFHPLSRDCCTCHWRNHRFRPRGIRRVPRIEWEHRHYKHQLGKCRSWCNHRRRRKQRRRSWLDPNRDPLRNHRCLHRGIDRTLCKQSALRPCTFQHCKYPIAYTNRCRRTLRRPLCWDSSTYPLPRRRFLHHGIDRMQCR